MTEKQTGKARTITILHQRIEWLESAITELSVSNITTIRISYGITSQLILRAKSARRLTAPIIQELTQELKETEEKLLSLLK